jgi:hypothetical protein
VNDFRRTLDAVIAETTPQPWDYTTPNGTTLTVIPAGLREDKGNAEVIIRITADKATAAEVGVTTQHMTAVLRAVDASAPLEHVTWLGDVLAITPIEGGRLSLLVSEVQYDPRGEVTAAIILPAEQRLPFASALRRATDVARGWED